MNSRKQKKYRIPSILINTFIPFTQAHIIGLVSNPHSIIQEITLTTTSRLAGAGEGEAKVEEDDDRDGVPFLATVTAAAPPLPLSLPLSFLVGDTLFRLAMASSFLACILALCSSFNSMVLGTPQSTQGSITNNGSKGNFENLLDGDWDDGEPD